MKRKSTEWEKIFANHISDEELVFRRINKVYKEYEQPDLKVGKGLE